jgi:hypothetical protein
LVEALATERTLAVATHNALIRDVHWRECQKIHGENSDRYTATTSLLSNGRKFLK